MSIRQLLRLMRNGVSLGDGQVRLTHYRPVMPIGYRKKYFRGSFKFSIVTYLKKNITPLKTWNLKIHAFFSSLKLRILKDKFLPISLTIIITPNTLSTDQLTVSHEVKHKPWTIFLKITKVKRYFHRVLQIKFISLGRIFRFREQLTGGKNKQKRHRTGKCSLIVVVHAFTLHLIYPHLSDKSPPPLKKLRFPLLC